MAVVTSIIVIAIIIVRDRFVDTKQTHPVEESSYSTAGMDRINVLVRNPLEDGTVDTMVDHGTNISMTYILLF